MKKMTNKENLSLPIAVWCLMDDYEYDKRDNVISVTTLLKPIQQIYLGRKYKDNIKEIDAYDLIASKMGSSLHTGIEEAWKKKDKVVEILKSLGYMTAESIYDKVTFEKRSEKEYDIDGKKYIISGQFDIVFDGYVCDNKSTTVWSYIFGSKKEDYRLQESIYKVLNPDLIDKDKGFIEYIFTDWSSAEALRNKQYPQKRNISIELDLLSEEETEKYIIDKLTLLKKYEDLNDDRKVQECTDEELWKDKTVWKLYKPNKDGVISYKRSYKNFDNKEDAYKMATAKDKVVEVKGGAKRCNYCNYINICNQYSKLSLMGEIKK